MTRDQSKRERMRDEIAALFRHAPGEERPGDKTPGEIADIVLDRVWPELDERLYAAAQKTIAIKDQAISEAQAAIERVRDLHWRSPDRRCAECGCGWPCPTRFALDNRPAKKRKGLSSPGGAS